MADIESTIVFLAASEFTNGCHDGVYGHLRKHGYEFDEHEYAAIMDSLAERGLLSGGWVGNPVGYQRGGPIWLSPGGRALKHGTYVA